MGAGQGRATATCSGSGQRAGRRRRWAKGEGIGGETYQVDFVMLCVGRFSGEANIPEFAPNQGPEAFDGEVIHLIDYSAMDEEKAADYVKGKKVTVVGFQKSALDITQECATVNGVENPVTVIIRKPHWNVSDYLPWGVPLAFLYLNRLSELTAHKPSEGLLLSLLAAMLSPLHHAQEISKLHVLADGEDRLVKSELVILATGFKGVEKLKGIFASPSYQECIAGSLDRIIPLYRQCIPLRIPCLAVIGFSESLSNLYTSEVQCRWFLELIDGTFKLPSIQEMDKDISRWNEFHKSTLSNTTGDHALEHFIYGIMISCARIWAGTVRGRKDCWPI
ncbi:hypothetical protein Drorol1_Dr00020733 [Drosera rotundifolia]